MDAFLQRMIQQFHEEIFQRMSPEARARKLTMMRTLAKTMRTRKKENENSLNNNTALPVALSFKQSTPFKDPQITDLDDVVSDSASETKSEEEILENSREENSPNEELSEKLGLVITNMCEPVTGLESTESEIVLEDTDCSLEGSDNTVTNEHEDKNKHWRSLEVLHETAEYEFCRSLEESKLHVSSASLLEEIEADLPSLYSLAKPFNYTFHTVSSYRTQTRLARMVRFGLPSKEEKDLNSTCPDFLKQEDWSKTTSLTGRIDYLEVEAKVQKVLADQAEKALNLSKTQKLLGIQHLESEKAFLLANLRHQAAIQEIKKTKLSGEISSEGIFGQVTIFDIFFQIDASTENSKEQYLCVATEKESVQSSSVVSDELNGRLHFNEHFKFDKLGKNFIIFLELYKLEIKEPKKTIMKTALVKKLKRMTPVNTNRSITCSFHGKSSFVRVISAELRLDHITRREDDTCVLLNTLPERPAGTTTLRVKTDIKASFNLHGFLNVFMHTWHRRWFRLSGYYLESWLYPEDCDSEKGPVDSIYLPDCTSVSPVGIEVCIRPNCFAINLRLSEEKILFSADSNTNMDQWVNNLNSVMESILSWKPNI